MTDIIYISRNGYRVFENYLFDLYEAQDNYCMDDLLVFVGFLYDHEDLEKALKSDEDSICPMLFEHDPTDPERWDAHRLFYSTNDWWEGESWAVVDAVYSVSELTYVPGKGIDGRAMELLGRDDRRVKE